MARARTIKPGFFTNDTLGSLPPVVRLLFAGLWTISDRNGRLEDRPVRIKALLLPYDSVNVNKALTTLADSGFIVRYQLDGAKYIEIANFRKHQTPHLKEGESTIPAPDKSRASTGNSGASLPISITYNPSPVNCNPEPAAPPLSVEEPSRTFAVQSRTGMQVVESTPIDAWFAEFWELYPRKTAKAAAQKAAKSKATSQTARDEILAGLRAHLPTLAARDPQYIPHASTWLNGERWRDPPETALTVSNPQQQPLTYGMQRHFNTLAIYEQFEKGGSF